MADVAAAADFSELSPPRVLEVEIPPEFLLLTLVVFPLPALTLETASATRFTTDFSPGKLMIKMEA